MPVLRCCVETVVLPQLQLVEKICGGQCPLWQVVRVQQVQGVWMTVVIPLLQLVENSFWRR